MPKGRNFPLPAPVKIRIGKPLEPGEKETSREFGSRVEAAVQALAAGSQSPQITGSWIERWNAGAQRPARR
jgi:hypothetical protein